MSDKPLVCQNTRKYSDSFFAHTPLTMAVLLASTAIGITSQNVFAGAPTNWPKDLDELIEAGVVVSNEETSAGGG